MAGADATLRHIIDTVAIVLLSLLANLGVQANFEYGETQIRIHANELYALWLLIFISDWASIHLRNSYRPLTSPITFCFMLIYLLLEAFACIFSLEPAADPAVYLLLASMAIGIVYDTYYAFSPPKENTKLLFTLAALVRALLFCILMTSLLLPRYITGTPGIPDPQGVLVIAFTYVTIKFLRLWLLWPKLEEPAL